MMRRNAPACAQSTKVRTLAILQAALTDAGIATFLKNREATGQKIV
jgi:hypothetical protein